NLLRSMSRLEEAEVAFADALALQKQLAAEFPARPEFRQELASSQNNLGIFLRTTGRLKAAEAAYTDAVALRKQLAAAVATRPAPLIRPAVATRPDDPAHPPPLRGPAGGGGGGLRRRGRLAEAAGGRLPRPTRVPPGPGPNSQPPGARAPDCGSADGRRGAPC